MWLFFVVKINVAIFYMFKVKIYSREIKNCKRRNKFLSKSIITNDFLTELNQNGVLFDWEQYKQQIHNEKLIQNGIVDKINSQLEYPIDFNELDELAFALYKNNIYPREITFNYFKENRQENPIYELLYKYKKIGQKITLLSNIKKYRSEDGRVRGEWQLNSSATKRLGCSKPNLMSLPKIAKDCVIPGEEKTIIQCDFSQIELRILAEITQDEMLMSSFNSGCDIHTATASLVYGKPTTEITEDERNSCKAINYGIAYGISSQGIKDNLNKLKIPVTLSQAACLRNRFLDIFSGIKEYQASVCMAKTLTSLGETKISTENMKPSQCLNWPIQTSCSEVLLASLNYLMINKDLSTKLINSIHDEIWIEVDNSLVNQEADMLILSMQQGFQKYVKSVKFDGDLKFIERI